MPVEGGWRRAERRSRRLFAGERVADILAALDAAATAGVPRLPLPPPAPP